MKLNPTHTFALTNFEGTLDFLLHLVQKSEIDIYEVSLQQITAQYLLKFHAHLATTSNVDSNVDRGAEFIATAASLLWLKSKMLLPKHEQLPQSLEEEEIDPRFEIIHYLLDYCRFKDAAKELSQREEHQSAFYVRGTDNPIEVKKHLGIEHLSLQDLALLFQQVVARCSVQSGLINEEEWLVGDKITLIRKLLCELKKIRFEILFSIDKCREELIVTFLAILELMKLGEAGVIKDMAADAIMIVHK